jgi:hypothetical protein
VRGPRQALVGKGRIHGRELRVTVGRQIDAIEGLVVQGEREGQCYGRDAVVAMGADVRRAWHDRTSDLGYTDLTR